ncbi:acyltransferase domain-containing protein [Streptomyces sp. LBUM 1476]|uniref:[acyl-carrier-protein] S-malonyltransferase n=2 Tax=Streptomyces acidiscabies TaxID=42234 RepID=A0ABU4M6K1_9ACTN|nr:acyltransferase domain-containing protein [Streptomyces acidiscabies]MBP5934989.1 acyltransferase domain-containing protein [Streptomyces sp. LBUM 1476]MDX3023262.1 acyltransferase domain-containing protein [Streptomyces acidiscabies]GAQ51054.1 malonyl CoA-acyl carrier protein transacylase [Streptomyces acidiscabies]GAV46382.1 malonyl CoA-acyl carrier protein transacylase [Streptomyces acidiscabies]
MIQRTAVMFPGQGAYLPGALADLVHVDGVDEVLKEVDEAVAGSVREVLTDHAAPTADTLLQNDPERLHLALYAGSLAVWRLLSGPLGVRHDVLFGHSVGELTALVAAGAIGVADGARLLAARDTAFRTVPPPPGGMFAVRLGADRLGSLVRGCALPRTHIAADNAPRQAVVSGPDDELAVLASVLDTLGVDRFRLRSAYPFHSPLLSQVTAHFRSAVEEVRISAPVLPVYSPTDGGYHRDADSVRAAIVRHLTQPVYFRQALAALYGDGVERFVECGPKSILADLVAENLPGAEAVAPLRTRRGLDAMRAALGGTGPVTVPPARQPAVPAPAPESPEPVLPSSPVLLKELQQLYADALEYPLDVLTADADLEADLAVDSVRQIELFSRALDRYGLPRPEARLRVTSYPTLSQVARLLGEIADGVAS